MTLSIITINKNNKDGLKKTLESVLIQNYKDFEYIIIDGSSTDGSIHLIQQFSEVIKTSDKFCKLRFNYLSESDTGVFQAMNKGVKMAIGDYLLFLNSGDYLSDENVIERVFKKLHTGEILCGRCNIIQNNKVVHTTNPPDNITFGTLYFTGLAHQSTFIKRSLFDKLGFYREDFKYNSDIDFWYRAIILNGAITEKIDEIISFYNLEGISSKNNLQLDFLKEHQEILSNELFQKFIPDYDGWKKERAELKELYWVRSKKILYNVLLLFYKVAQIYNKSKLK